MCDGDKVDWLAQDARVPRVVEILESLNDHDERPADFVEPLGENRTQAKARPEEKPGRVRRVSWAEEWLDLD